jgi:hypothetical protein
MWKTVYPLLELTFQLRQSFCQNLDGRQVDIRGEHTDRIAGPVEKPAQEDLGQIIVGRCCFVVCGRGAGKIPPRGVGRWLSRGEAWERIRKVREAEVTGREIRQFISNLTIICQPIV